MFKISHIHYLLNLRKKALMSGFKKSLLFIYNIGRYNQLNSYVVLNLNTLGRKKKKALNKITFDSGISISPIKPIFNVLAGLLHYCNCDSLTNPR